MRGHAAAADFRLARTVNPGHHCLMPGWGGDLHMGQVQGAKLREAHVYVTDTCTEPLQYIRTANGLAAKSEHSGCGVARLIIEALLSLWEATHSWCAYDPLLVPTGGQPSGCRTGEAIATV